jgi:hypothetical protein
MPVLVLQKAPPGEEADFAFPDNTKFLVEITGVNTRKTNLVDDDNNPVTRLSFDFKVVEGPEAGRKLQQDVYNEFNEGVRCRLFQWAKVLFGVSGFPPGFHLDTDDLVGKQAIATLGVREWPRADGSTGRKNSVKYLSPVGDAGSTGSGPQLASVPTGVASSVAAYLNEPDSEEPF